jgi:O-glycosyl hydrolase
LKPDKTKLRKVSTALLFVGGLLLTTNGYTQVGGVATAQPTAESMTITVEAGARQRFAGFGASLGNWAGEYQQLPATKRAALSQMLWRDLNFKILRLWFNTFQFRPQPGARDLSAFRKNYVDSGLITDAKQNGVTTLLLAPDGLPDSMKEKRAGGGVSFKAGEEENYAVLLADFIQQLKDETGVRLDATGVQNEPNDNEQFSPQQIVAVVKHLRRELDRRGLQSVAIIAPEHASADGVLYEQVDALKSDPTAWAALAGIASHSYNMCASGEIARRLAGPDERNLKTYWMTEASDNGPEEAGDVLRAASLAGRFLNDMNHRVTHWIHFLGFEVADPKDNATRIIAYDLQPSRTVVFAKYFYYQQLARTFDVGALFRQGRSSLEGEMAWEFGQKPRLTAAAAQNPDGSWGIGLCNYTADRFDQVNWSDAKWNREQGGHTPGQTFQVTVQVPELRELGDIAFKVHRRSADHPNTSEDSATMRKGEITLRVAPLELVTLRSGKR